VQDASEIEPVVSVLAREPNGGLVVMPDTFTLAHRVEITSLAARYRLPAVYPFRNFADVGGLLSYGVDPARLFVSRDQTTCCHSLSRPRAYDVERRQGW